MIKYILFVAVAASVSISACKSSATSDGDAKEEVVNVKEEIEQTAESIEDSTGKVDVQKLEQMMEDAK